MLKSTCVPLLTEMLNTHVVLDSDILWDNRFNTPEDQYRAYREMWLRVSKNINQSGRPVVLCGTALPEQLESCLERRYFSHIHYLALVCDSDELRNRLRARPTWRESSDDAFVQGMVQFNQWLKDNATACVPAISLLDTTGGMPNETAKSILQWVQRNP